MATSVLTKNIFVVAARRTPCGAFGGKLRDISATELGTIAAKSAIQQAGVAASEIGTVVYGNVQQTSKDAAYLARHIGLQAGVATNTPSLTVNRLCGSGFEAVVQGAKDILLGESSLVLAGGTESMSQAPFAARNIRFGVKLGQSPELEDTLWGGLTDTYCNLPMGVTAENLAKQYNITREESDQFALRSQQNWAKANEQGVFNDEIAPVEIKTRKGTNVVDVDEHPRPETTMEQLAKLPTVFDKNGVVTAGTSSGICDGGAALLLASEEAVKELGLTPLARVAGWSTAGVEPQVMGIGPVPAVRQLLSKIDIPLSDIGLIEVNEAFGAQCLAVAKELEIDMNKLNIHGGAIAIGHPLGMSGARILTHLTHSLNRSDESYALGAACIGGGQGIAVLLERA